MEKYVVVGAFLLFLFLLGFGYGLLKLILGAARHSMLRKGFWGEQHLYEWLQDRAVARTLGADIDLVRARRRIDSATAPINVSQKN